MSLLITNIMQTLAIMSSLVCNSTQVVLAIMIHSLLHLSTQLSNLEYVTPVEWLVQRKTSDMVEPTNKSVLLNAKSVHVIDGVGR